MEYKGHHYHMERVIYPVGIGSFCRERFIRDDETIVFDMMYDCGTLSGKGTMIRSELNELYSTKPIDLVFISHFDDDHINEFQKVIGTPAIIPGKTTIILPQIRENILLEKAGVGFYVNYNLLRTRIQDDGYRVIDVLPMPEGYDGLGESSIDIEELNRPIRSGTKITINDHLWEYIPFNCFNEQEEQELVELLKNKTHFDDAKLEDIFKGNITDQDIDILKNAYQKLGPRKNVVTFINRNSLQLLSKENKDIRCFGHIKYNNMWLCRNTYIYGSIRYTYEDCRPINASCLYTGDSIMDATLLTIQNKYLGGYSVGLFQIPHHGSIHCYNQYIVDNLNFQCAYVNTDLSSSRVHVASEIFDWNYINKRPLLRVLKDEGYIIEFVY